MKKLPCMTTPCVECPFKKSSLRGWLGGNRAEEIVNSSSFVCHKTLSGKKTDRRQCAGHMILMNNENSFYRLAQQLNMLPELSGTDLIFNSKQEFIEHHDLNH